MPNSAKRYRAANQPQRASAAKRGYGYAWQEARDWFVRRHPLCVDCLAQGIVNDKKIEAHHIVKKIDGGGDNEENLMALCQCCHAIRTRRGE